MTAGFVVEQVALEKVVFDGNQETQRARCLRV
jgi:hypothetical protein